MAFLKPGLTTSNVWFLLAHQLSLYLTFLLSPRWWSSSASKPPAFFLNTCSRRHLVCVRPLWSSLTSHNRRVELATTLVLKMVVFVLWMRRLLFHTLLSLLKAALALPIRALISLAVPPCLSTLVPRYTKLSTSSTSLSLIINGSSLPRLYLKTLVLSILIFKPTFPPNWFSLFNLSGAWLHLLDKCARSSAKSSRVIEGCCQFPSDFIPVVLHSSVHDPAGLAQWWERSPSTNVSRVRFPDPASYVWWVCWFSTLLREVFLRELRFSPLLKNQHLIWFDLIYLIYLI